MQTATAASVNAIRHDMRRAAGSPLLPRLWHSMRQEWQQMADRRAARAVYLMDHAGVRADYQMAMRGRR